MTTPRPDGAYGRSMTATTPARGDGLIRVVLADDQALVRAGFAALLDAEDDIAVVGEAADGTEAVALAERSRPDVLLMDIRMPGLDGIEATRRIAARPGLGGVHIVIVTTFDLDEYVFEGLRAGAAGFLLKDTDAAELIRAVRVAAGGDALLSPAVTRRLVAEFAARTRPMRQPAHCPRARGADPDRARPVQRPDRRAAVHEPVHGQDARRAGDDEARRPRPGAARGHCLRGWPGPPRLERLSAHRRIRPVPPVRSGPAEDPGPGRRQGGRGTLIGVLRSQWLAGDQQPVVQRRGHCVHDARRLGPGR